MVGRINTNIFSNNKLTDISRKVPQYVHVVPYWKIQLGQIQSQQSRYMAC